MRIMMIGPQFGGIHTYLFGLANALRQRGHVCDCFGLDPSCNPYSPVTEKWRTSADVLESVQKYSAALPIHHYDRIGFHFGKNDLEQAIPLFLDRKHTPPAIYFVHFMSRNLFSSYLNDEPTQTKIEHAVRSFFSGYIFYGQATQKSFPWHKDNLAPSLVAPYPETNSNTPVAIEEVATYRQTVTEKFQDPTAPLCILPGYAAEYKDSDLLFSACQLLPQALSVLIIGRGWKKRIGWEQQTFGKVEVLVEDRELSPKEFTLCCHASDFGIFPYHDSTSTAVKFQGSGTLPNFLSAGKPCIVLNSSVMPEYVKDPELIANRNSTEDVANKLSRMLDPEYRQLKTAHLANRRKLFSMEAHALACQEFFSSF